MGKISPGVGSSPSFPRSFLKILKQVENKFSASKQDDETESGFRKDGSFGKIILEADHDSASQKISKTADVDGG
ncbi:MAG: hypothetical protein AUK17_00010 [Parcubacteria group bacterium CG2_30_44_18]|nr:MAG: hypothetical protein AUK17_00010 [Parcubacteria group bacterium CG2_30_44_18]